MLSRAVLERYLPHAAHQLLTLPQRAFEASERFRLGGEYDPGPALETALLAIGARGTPNGSVSRAIGEQGSELPGSAANPMASRSTSIYNPPVKPPRPFSADYPHGAQADATGRLTHDIEGRPLVAERVVGRRTLGGADEAVTPVELDGLAKRILGSRPEVVAASSLPKRAVGAYDPNTGNTFVYRGLPPEVKDMVAAHEVSHGINDLAGKPVASRMYKSIPLKPGTVRELQKVYNDLNNYRLAKARAENPNVDPARVYWGTGVTPEKTFGYSKTEAPIELMTEAIRAYLADPNYIKSVAPAAIRAAVNSDPRLSKILQFNSVAGPVGAGLMAGGTDPETDRDAFWDAWRRGDAL